MKFVIYKATNTATGKSYVGKTAAGLPKRKREHLACARLLTEGSSIFHRALNSYGEDNFIWEILEFCSDHASLNDREVFHIANLKTCHPFGYNMTAGSGSYGFARSEETKKKLSEKGKEQHQDPEYRANVYPKLKGLVPPNKGVPMSDAQKTKVSAARKAVHADPNYVNPNVGQKRTGKALENLHKGYETRKLPTGDDWVKAHGDQYTPEARAKMRAAKLGKKPANTRKVQCIETEAVYDGLTEAANGTGAPRQSIYLQIKGKIKKAGGLTFRYLDSSSPDSDT
jgi:group I intron endonuclease